MSTWFRPELRNKKYDDFGDAYDDDKYDALAEKWHVEPTKTNNYLIFVKQASKEHWIHLRLLADFMQIGRIPRDWKKEREKLQGGESRDSIWAKANVRRLSYSRSVTAAVQKHVIVIEGGHENPQTKVQNKEHETDDPSQVSLRLYVLEDLSRNVIEAFGTKLGIEPDFFRAHIAEYAWYNVRDRWRGNHPLELVRHRRNWLQIRYVTARYFEDDGSFKNAVTYADDNFNILRRLDNDESKAWWDIPKPGGSGNQVKPAIVALTRCRATFWLKSKATEDEAAIGVLLLDPTVPKGFPLWRGHANFHPVPPPENDPSTWPTWKSPSQGNTAKNTFFEEFIYWATHPEAFSSHLGADQNMPREHLPLQALLHLVVSEWLTMCEYIKTRLNQVDLETIDPKHFAHKQHVDVALGKLHMWRKQIPLFREMVSETLRDVFRFRCSELDRSTASCPQSSDPRASLRSNTLKAYEDDFQLVLKNLEEYQARIDRLTSVVTAVMAVEDTRRASTDARNLGLLTWLATFFIPFSVLSGIFSMQKVEDISINTIRLYFAVTIPVSCVTLVIAWSLHSAVIRKFIEHPRQANVSTKDK